MILSLLILGRFSISKTAAEHLSLIKNSEQWNYHHAPVYMFHLWF